MDLVRDRSSGGTAARIIARAKRSHVGTVYIKAGDGVGGWRQFTKSLVSSLHAGGLKVCAWQFVYGDAPVKEANVAAAAVAKGADCLMIDAEGQYEGKYASADRYMRKLRAQIGADFPVSLAAFPYVDYHPAFPYSVFLGPGRRPVQPAADVLEDDRDQRRAGLRAHLPLQPRLPAADLPDRADLREPATQAAEAVPAAMRINYGAPA